MGHIELIRTTRRKLARDGPPRVREAGDFAAVTLPERDCDAVRDLLIAERPGTVIEVGLAYVDERRIRAHPLRRQPRQRDLRPLPQQHRDAVQPRRADHVPARVGKSGALIRIEDDVPLAADRDQRLADGQQALRLPDPPVTPGFKQLVPFWDAHRSGGPGPAA